MDGEGQTVSIRFECDGRAFEYSVVPTKQGTRPPGWRAQRSPGPTIPVVLVVVRKPGTEIGPAIVFPAGTVPTVDHAIEVARKFSEQLA
jgi:hypothetical protein